MKFFGSMLTVNFAARINMKKVVLRSAVKKSSVDAKKFNLPRFLRNNTSVFSSLVTWAANEFTAKLGQLYKNPYPRSAFSFPEVEREGRGNSL